jgi:hypothetical protein
MSYRDRLQKVVYSSTGMISHTAAGSTARTLAATAGHASWPSAAAAASLGTSPAYQFTPSDQHDMKQSPSLSMQNQRIDVDLHSS